MNRKLWSHPSFTETNTPEWICPSCNAGKLSLAKNSLVSQETIASKERHHDEDWDPTWINTAFSAFFMCGNCGEPIAVSGWGTVTERIRLLPDGSVDDSTEDQFFPEFFTKAPHLIEIPVDCDPNIEIEIEKSFQLYFVDANSCANKIRVTIEMILDGFKIPRKKRITRGGNAEVRSMSLHERILKYGQKNLQAANRLLAIKWIGNSGSHGGTLERNDLLDAYEIFEIALSEIYDFDKKRADKLTKAINKKKGPLTKKKRT